MVLVQAHEFETGTRYELKILQQCDKKIKTKSQKVLGPNSDLFRSYRGETVRGGIFAPPSWIGLRPLYNYLTSFPQNIYIAPSFKLAKSKYRIAIRALKLLNIILNIEEKFIEKYASFKATIKTKSVSPKNATIYFWCIYKTLNSLTRIFWKRN